MLMNPVETALVNSLPRRWLERCYEVPVLARSGGRLAQGRGHWRSGVVPDTAPS